MKMQNRMNEFLSLLKRWAVVVAIICPLSVFSQMEDLIKMDFDTLRTDGYSVHDYQFNAGNEWQVLNFIKKFENDPHKRVQLHVRMVRAQLAYKTADTLLRQQIVETFVEDCMSPDPYISQYVYERLQYVQQNDFSPRAKQLLITVFKKGKYERRFLLICGVAQVKQLIPSLKKMAVKFDRTKDDWQGTIAWYASLALLRMGASANVDAMITAVELEANDIYRVGILLRFIAYTRHPDCIRLLRKYLETSARLPAIRESLVPSVNEELGVPYNQYALNYLARYLENFPVKFNDSIGYSTGELETARAYFRNKENRR
jgi:hypothetical protein